MSTFKRNKNEVTIFCDCGKFSHRLFVEDGEMNLETARITPQPANKNTKEEEPDETQSKSKKKSSIDEFFSS